MVVANAAGCSSIYGGNLPSTPWATDENGHGLAWANSLFEDNAEFGLGMRLALDQQQDLAKNLVKKFAADLGTDLVDRLVNGEQKTDADFDRVRADIAALKAKLAGNADVDAKRLVSVVDALLKRSLWFMSGDGWAYDIGYGGLDLIFSLGRNVNILVLDTEDSRTPAFRPPSPRAAAPSPNSQPAANLAARKTSASSPWLMEMSMLPPSPSAPTATRPS